MSYMFLVWQSKANIELELKTYKMKYDQEVLAHKETIAKFNADKKHILMSTEEANMEAIKGTWIQTCFPKLPKNMEAIKDMWNKMCRPHKLPKMLRLKLNSNRK